MDYGELVTSSFKSAWKNRVLWVFGFLAALTGAGDISSSASFSGSYRTSANSAGSTSPSDLARALGITEAQVAQLQQLAEKAVQYWWVLALGIGVAILIFSILSGLFGSWAKASLIGAVDQIEDGLAPRLSEGFAIGKARFWKLFLTRFSLGLPGLLFSLILIGVILATLAPIVSTISTSGGISNTQLESFTLVLFGLLGVTCVCIAVSFPIAIVLNILTSLAERAVVLDKLGVRAAIGKAWMLSRQNLGKVALTALMAWGIGIGFGFINALILLPIGLIAFPFMITGAVWIAILLGLLVLPIGMLFATALTTISGVLWTKFYRQLVGKLPPVLATTVA